MRIYRCSIFLLLAVFAINTESGTDSQKQFVKVSPGHRYFELSNGEPYIPIGLNMLQAYQTKDPQKHMEQFEDWMKNLSDNGGNYIRVWLSAPFWDVEHEKSGVFDEEKAKRIDALLQLARKYNIRIKFTLEHFRYIGEGNQSWAAKSIHQVTQGGPANTMADFFDGEKSREQFKHKLKWFAKRFGDDPMVYGWELWNEINAVQGGEYVEWTRIMLQQLHSLFPKNLCMQSLGSFDTDRVRDLYRRMSTMPGNDVAQVHRYLDLGAKLDVCKGPVDVLAAEAVRELLRFNPMRPVILAESGAVEPSHSGPFKLYKADKNGMLLHDILFAPFFAGAAGPGQIWHWDAYVAPNTLWWQFGRFTEAIKGINPLTEQFEPMMIEHPRLRIYALKGKTTVLAWCRDSQNTWETELKNAIPPETLTNLTIPVNQLSPPNGKIDVFDPWKNEWSRGNVDNGTVTLPPFQRSIVIRYNRSLNE